MTKRNTSKSKRIVLQEIIRNIFSVHLVMCKPKVAAKRSLLTTPSQDFNLVLSPQNFNIKSPLESSIFEQVFSKP